MLFSAKKEKNNYLHHFYFLILLVVIGLFTVFGGFIHNSNSGYNRKILEDALTRSITQCYALEGMYPPNLSYLEDNYGLTYDRDYYFIDYTYIGSNLRPDVTIIEKD